MPSFCPVTSSRGLVYLLGRPPRPACRETRSKQSRKKIIEDERSGLQSIEEAREAD